MRSLLLLLASVATNAMAVIPGWHALTTAPHPSTCMRLTLALKLQNADRLEEHLLAVSSPASSTYGQYLSPEDINRAYPTLQDAERIVHSWVLSAGTHGAVHVDTSAHGFVVVDLPISAAERLYETPFAEYRSILDPKRRTFRARHPMLARGVPQMLASVVDFVAGIDHFPSQKTQSHINSTAAVALRTGLGTDPPSLRSMYQIGDAVATHPNSTQATGNFLHEGFSDDDLRFFFEVFDADGEGQKVSHIVGLNNNPSVEASLDIQYLMSIGQGATTWWISDDDTHDHQEPFLQYMLQLSNTSDTPKVHSLSYADLEPSVSVAYTKRVDQEFMKAGLRGISILVASGDSGAGCSKDETKLVPQWPSSSSWITSVGSTEIPASGPKAEAAVAFSGGGFSSIFARPAYQDDAVASYRKALGSRAPPSGMFNASGRAIPDVAIMGTLYSVIVDQEPTIVQGTSASTPVWAGIVTLLNDARFHAKMPALGFLNPWLYSTQGAFRDIATGASTPGGGSGDECGKARLGWPAVVGYDTSTGLGVPIFTKLKKAALNKKDFVSLSVNAL